jgi:cell division protein FtsQ
MRERRVAVVRAQGRRRLRWLIAVMVVGTLVAAAWLVTHSTLLDIDRVRVTGTQHVSADEVRRATGVHRGDPILFVDVGAVERRVEQIAWVDRARVERRLPGELHIRVTERSPAAWARRAPDRVSLVDGRGRVLADAADPPAELPELAGLAALPRPGRQITPAAGADIIEKLPAELRLRAARVVVSGGEITLVLRDGPEVRFGAPDHVSTKARAALAVLGAAGGRPPTYVDVRVPTAPVTG